MSKERDDGGVYVYTAQSDEALAVDDLGRKGRKGRGKPAAPAIEDGRFAPTVPAPSPDFGDDDLEPSVPVETDATVAPAEAGAAPRALVQGPRTAPPTDPVLAEVEQRVARGDWAGMEQALFESAPSVDALAPRLRLLWAVAVKESETKRTGTNADAIAIAATAEILGVDPRSQLALVVAKRLLRRRAISSRPAPKPWVSWIIVIIAIAIGAAVGFFFA